MFKLINQDLGTKIAGKELILEFPYDNIKVITRMESPCDCSIPSDIRTQNKVVVRYTPKKVPQHLVAEGKNFYKTEKNILVTYLDSNETQRTETLTFTATIHD